MEEIPVVTVIHKLPGRIRLHLSVEPKDHQLMIASVKDHEGFESMTYTPVTRSVLINFDPKRVKREEILIRVALYMSLDQESHCAHIFSQPAKQEMSDSVFYSGISLLIALLLRLVRGPGTKVSWTEWIAGGSTAMAVLEHGWSEIKREGNFDPEVLSVVYLLIAILRKNFLPAAIFTWVSTFGRHLVDIPSKGVELRPVKKSGQHDEARYEVEVSTIKNADDKMIIFSAIPSILKYAFTGDSMMTGRNLLQKIQEVSELHGEVLDGIESFRDGITLKFI
ncbi:MAG: hypothetical protein ACLP2X_12385 [Syntrophobacteraceae bacterium]|jgi:hypothetical protein